MKIYVEEKNPAFLPDRFKHSHESISVQCLINGEYRLTMCHYSFMNMSWITDSGKYVKIDYWLRETDSSELEIRYSRWLLKYAESIFDNDGLLCYKFENELYTPQELHKIYLKLS